jgi:hypothetical protein
MNSPAVSSYFPPDAGPAGMSPGPVSDVRRRPRVTAIAPVT